MPSGDKVHIAIFASGTGSNALKIIEHFKMHPGIEVCAVICNNPHAGVIAHAHQHHIPSIIVTRRLLNDETWFMRQMEALKVDYIVLAGFLLLIPEYLVDAYTGKIVNIHPALLPKYGGKGMYGMHVHNAVRESGDTETGITIHCVNAKYDDGEILRQVKTQVTPDDTAEQIAEKVHRLEHAWYPQVIEDWILSE